MKRFVIIGSSTPLQKTLPLFASNPSIQLQAVFLDEKIDSASIKWCEKNNIPWHPASEIKTENGLQIIQNLHPDWILSVNSIVIIPASVLQSATEGALNLHPGKLPEYAGLHTHQWAIRNGETQFGVTLHHMETGVDTGDIAYQTIFDISETDTGLSLFLKCISEGTLLVQKAIQAIADNHEITHIPQDLSRRKLFTHKMALDGQIDWNRNSKYILDFIRAANYEPFSGPTYSPLFSYKNKSFILVKAVPSSFQFSPGEIISNAEGVFAGTLDYAIKIEKIKHADGSKADLSEIN